MTVFFISDIHLNQESPESYNLLVKFFNSLPPNTQTIYILGDLFEYWIDDNINNEFLTKIKLLFQKIPNNINIYFIHGNRDFLMDNNFAEQINIKLLPAFYKTKIYGHNILLTHGDYLVSDQVYYYFSKIIRHPIIKILSKKLPFNIKLVIAKILRYFSKYRFKHNKNTNIYDVSQKLVEKYLLQYDCSILIHGHTHKPNIYNFNIKDQKFTRIVLGDWHNHTSIVSFNEQNYELEKIWNN